jgi:hypothetical protein
MSDPISAPEDALSAEPPSPPPIQRRRNFIKAVQVGVYGSPKKITLPLAYPQAAGSPYCINALCGRNNSGKSHILREIGQAFDDRSLHNAAERESVNIHAVLLDPQAPPPSVLYLPDLTEDKSRLNQIPLTFKHDPQGRTPKYREAIVRFLADQLSGVWGTEFEKERWTRDADYRKEIVDRLEERVLYRCTSESPVLRRFEEAVGGNLYFGKKGPGKKVHLELAIRYDDHRIFYFQSWSEGQKTLLTALLYIHHHRPDVLLLDEIENHFHPEYITQLTQFLRDVVPQTLLVTHHPHVLFSNLVDRLFYLEMQAARDPEAPNEVRLPQGFQARSPQRRIAELATEFDRITAAYGLFHNQDRQLLTLAQATHQSIDTSFTASLLRLFLPVDDEAGESSAASLPLQQIEDLLVDSLRTLRQKGGPFHVLDYGAARARSLERLLRTSSLPLGEPLCWSFWGVQPTSARLPVGRSGVDIRLVSPAESLPKDFYDLAILSNVLHEMTPKAFAATLAGIRRAVRAPGGSVAILEPFPLIRPEKYAVPYSREDMTDVLVQCGWKVESRQLPVPGGLVEAYCLLAHSPDSRKSLDLPLLEQAVGEKWREILARSCARYDGQRQIGTARDQIEVMGLLTTIASISNYSLGNWR